MKKRIFDLLILLIGIILGTLYFKEPTACFSTGLITMCILEQIQRKRFIKLMKSLKKDIHHG